MTGARAILAAAAVMVSGIAACGPIPVAQAERGCVEDARAASGPRGQVSMGVGTDGHRVVPVTRVEMSISSDYVMGRDPADVFNRCVMRRSGQMPTRPLYEQPGWSR